jgi:hypothetical protein
MNILDTVDSYVRKTQDHQLEVFTEWLRQPLSDHHDTLAEIQIYDAEGQLRTWITTVSAGKRIARVLRENHYHTLLKKTNATEVDNIRNIVLHDHIENEYTFDELITEHLCGEVL